MRKPKRKRRAVPPPWKKAARKMRFCMDYLSLPLEERNAFWHEFYSAGHDRAAYGAVLVRLEAKVRERIHANA